MRPKSDLPQGTLDLLILKVVALGPVHDKRSRRGWNRFCAVQVPGKGPLPLRCTGWKTAGFWRRTEGNGKRGREAKFYRLTGKGRAQLETEAASWERLTEAVALILKLSDDSGELRSDFWPRKDGRATRQGDALSSGANMPTN